MVKIVCSENLGVPASESLQRGISCTVIKIWAIPFWRTRCGKFCSVSFYLFLFPAARFPSKLLPAKVAGVTRNLVQSFQMRFFQRGSQIFPKKTKFFHGALLFLWSCSPCWASCPCVFQSGRGPRIDPTRLSFQTGTPNLWTFYTPFILTCPHSTAINNQTIIPNKDP